MIHRRFLLLLCIISLSLSGCNAGITDNDEDYRKIAAEVLVKTITADPNGAITISDIPESLYVYQWSDDPANDIIYMNTMINEDKNLLCEQFYATDGGFVWRGGVIFDTIKHEVIDTYSYHIFTSGITPVMSLQFNFRETGDTINLYDFYERGLLREDYGVFVITERTGELQLGNK